MDISRRETPDIAPNSVVNFFNQRAAEIVDSNFARLYEKILNPDFAVATFLYYYQITSLLTISMPYNGDGLSLGYDENRTLGSLLLSAEIHVSKETRRNYTREPETFDSYKLIASVPVILQIKRQTPAMLYFYSNSLRVYIVTWIPARGYHAPGTLPSNDAVLSNDSAELNDTKAIVFDSYEMDDTNSIQFIPPESVADLIMFVGWENIVNEYTAPILAIILRCDENIRAKLSGCAIKYHTYIRCGKMIHRTAARENVDSQISRNIELLHQICRKQGVDPNIFSAESYTQ